MRRVIERHRVRRRHLAETEEARPVRARRVGFDRAIDGEERIALMTPSVEPWLWSARTSVFDW